jgi:threonylcarbamoyladenosine tRNA methylthiotransferase MtaB
MDLLSGEGQSRFFHTFGCKVNTYDTGLLQQQLNGQTWSRPVHILNTCAVTAEATEEALRTARRIKRREPSAVVVATGCASQVDTEKLSAETSVDLVIANSHKHAFATLLQAHLNHESTERVFKSNIFKKSDLGLGGGLETQHTRSFLKIQDGCNSFCTFCVIPFARGRSQSLDLEHLVERIHELVDSGYNEIVLTGVHIGDYEDGQGHRLEDLVEAILVKTSLPRLRLSSLEPIEISPRLLSLFENPRLCPHFHMSIQSACSKVLREMKRYYEASDVEQALLKIAKALPHAFVGMDVIVGFPGESDAEFNETVERLKSLPWTRLHVFPYSQRPGTFAARRSDLVESAALNARASEMRQLSAQRMLTRAQQQIGHRKNALVLRDGFSGLSRDYWSLRWTKAQTPGTEVTVQVEGLTTNAKGETGLTTVLV